MEKLEIFLPKNPKNLKNFCFFLENLRYQKSILKLTDLYREVLQNFLHLEKLTICCVLGDRGVKESNKPENTFVATLDRLFTSAHILSVL